MRWAVLLALATLAHADGGFVSTELPVVEIPDQQAILVWRDGREHLVIDTAHAGQGDLAWIVPLPSPPRIEPVSPAVFRTIAVATMPRLRDEPNETWGLSVVADRWRALGLAALLAIFFLVGASMVMLTAKATPDGVAVLGRGRVGSYETATVQSVDAGALLRWLDGNGFKVAPEMRKGIEGYVRDGWVFAVARLTSGGSLGRAHPLSFTFEAKAPVYPLRLTGTSGRALSLRLFVFSDLRARCEDLVVESCYEVRAAKEPRRSFYRDQGYEREIGHPEVLAIADGATVLTTLAGELDPARMRADLHPVFEERKPLVPVFYTAAAARSGAAATAIWVALAMLLPCHLAASVIRKRKGAKRTAIVAWCVAIGIGLVAGVADYGTTDVLKTRSSGGGFKLLDSHYRAGEIATATNDLATARDAVAAYWRHERNPYDGGDVREEASPGNYGLELRDGKVLYVAYDATGMAMR
jgi:Uncharacterized protein conserved in bacteria (DUF2330)